MLKTISILAIAGLVLALAPTAQAAIISIKSLGGADTAEEFISTGSTSTGSSDLELGSENGTEEAKNQIVGVRFLNVTIPIGATINSASIQFTARDASTVTSPTLDIYGVLSANAAAFTSGTGLSGLDETTARVPWSSIPQWTHTSKYSTPGLKTIIQEIVDQGAVRLGPERRHGEVRIVRSDEIFFLEHGVGVGAQYSSPGIGLCSSILSK